MVTEERDFIVLSLRGSSQQGGDPDIVVNKYFLRWYLRPADGVSSNLYLKAIPFAHLERQHILRTWKENDTVRAQFVVHANDNDNKLDHGIILKEGPSELTPGNFSFTMQGNYVLKLFLECEPLTTGQTDAAQVKEPANPQRLQSDAPLDGPTIEEILADSTGGSGERDVVKESARKQTPEEGKHSKPENKTAESSTTMKETTKKLIMDTIALCCEMCGASSENVLGTSKDRASARVRRMVVHAITSARPEVDKTDLQKVLVPESPNVNAVNALGSSARKMYEDDQDFAREVNKVISTLKKGAEMDTGDRPPTKGSSSAKSGNSHREQAVAPPQDNGPVTFGLKDAAIYLAIKSGRDARKVACAFNVPITDVYAAFGRTAIENGGQVEDLVKAFKQVMGDD